MPRKSSKRKSCIANGQKGSQAAQKLRAQLQYQQALLNKAVLCDQECEDSYQYEYIECRCDTKVFCKNLCTECDEAYIAQMEEDEGGDENDLIDLYAL